MDLVIKADWSVNSSAVPACENATIEMSRGVRLGALFVRRYQLLRKANPSENDIRSGCSRFFLIIAVVVPIVVSAMVAPCV